MSFVMSELALLVQWVRERESIRVKKEKGLPKPWTTDPFLRDYRWCNVRRMDDRVSQELLQSWYQPDADGSTALAAALLARLINRTASLLEITAGRPFSLAALPNAREALARRAGRGDKVFTAAYIVPGVPGRSKIDSVCDLVEKVTGLASTVLKSSMRDTWAGLIEFDGLGSFLAGQVVADLAELKVGRAWPDATTWAPVGPGSARGLNRLMGIPKDKPVSQAAFDQHLPALIMQLRPLIEAIYADRKLTAFDVQNVLCESDKARRLQLKEGTVRARYPGAGETQMDLLTC